MNQHNRLQSNRDHTDPIDHLQTPVPAPDMTEPIMDKLGFGQVEESHARRVKRRRLMARLTTACCFIGAAAMGFQMYSMHEEAQRAQRPTIDGALPGIVQESSNRVDNVSRAIKTLMTPVDLNQTDDRPANLDTETPCESRKRRDCSVTRWAGLL